MRPSAITGLVLPGVLLATWPEGAAAQGAAAECVQETNGEYSKHRQCWEGGKRRGRWVIRLPGGEVREGAYVAGKKEGHWVVRRPDGGVQEGPYVADEKQGRWVLRHADGTVEEGSVVDGLREGRWVAHRPDGSRRTFEMAGGRLVEGSVRVAAQAQGGREAAAMTRAERRRVQSALAAQGFDPGPADGMFGARTIRAIKAWQASNGYAATGLLTGAQAVALHSPQAAPRRAQVAAPDAEAPPPRAIREAQELLAKLDYAPGPVDGIWSGRTALAYLSFLESAGLPPAERLTPEALRAMRAMAKRVGVAPSRATTGAAPPPGVLHRAAQAGDIVGLQAALSAGAAVDVRDALGLTALMYAVMKGYPVLVEPLLEAGADPNVRAPNGATALFMAVPLKYTEIVEQLMEAGADPLVRGSTGETAADAARVLYGEAEAAKESGEPLAIIALLEGRTLADVKDDDAFARARAAGTVEAYDAYLSSHPEGRSAGEARRLKAERTALKAKKDDDAFAKAKAKGVVEAYEFYLSSRPEGRHAEEARRLLARMEARAEEGRRLARRWPAGTKQRDCDECPELVVVPPGSFMRGSLRSEAGGGGDEAPQQQVTLDLPLAVGVYEVTRGEYSRFVSATGHAAGSSCRTYKGGEWKERSGRHWKKPGFSQQSKRHPVVCVSWGDAKAYVRWLSRQTGQTYRLLSESEWEYVARAETTGPFHTGATISTKQANYDGNHIYGSGRKGRYRKKTMPVGEFPANAFGLHDVHGNVFEWVEDCWNGDYNGAPLDGRARESGHCSRRVFRGGSWNDHPRDLRSASRGWGSTGYRSSRNGFRVARTLD